jgi:hypothetical protein
VLERRRLMTRVAVMLVLLCIPSIALAQGSMGPEGSLRNFISFRIVPYGGPYNQMWVGGFAKEGYSPASVQARKRIEATTSADFAAVREQTAKGHGAPAISTAFLQYFFQQTTDVPLPEKSQQLAATLLLRRDFGRDCHSTPIVLQPRGVGTDHPSLWPPATNAQRTSWTISSPNGIQRTLYLAGNELYRDKRTYERPGDWFHLGSAPAFMTNMAPGAYYSYDEGVTWVGRGK